MNLSEKLATAEGRADYAAQLVRYNADQLRTRKPFVWVMPLEAYDVSFGDAFASLQLGRTDAGDWLSSVSVGDGQGAAFSALGYLAPGPTPEEAHSARSAALAAGIARLEAWANRSYAEPRTAPIRARLCQWARELAAPQQVDLFTAA